MFKMKESALSAVFFICAITVSTEVRSSDLGAAALKDGNWEILQTADAVYSDKVTFERWQRVATWDEILPKEVVAAAVALDTDFYAAVYKNKVTGQHALAIRGTDHVMADFIETNIPRFVGRTATPETWSFLVALKAKERFPDLVVTGDSMGGGLATWAANSLGLRAVTMNSSGVQSQFREVMKSVDVTNFRYSNDVAVEPWLDGSIPKRFDPKNIYLPGVVHELPSSSDALFDRIREHRDRKAFLEIIQREASEAERISLMRQPPDESKEGNVLCQNREVVANSNDCPMVNLEDVMSDPNVEENGGLSSSPDIGYVEGATPTGKTFGPRSGQGGRIGGFCPDSEDCLPATGEDP